jgi:hypothetical protein
MNEGQKDELWAKQKKVNTTFTAGLMPMDNPTPTDNHMNETA